MSESVTQLQSRETGDSLESTVMAIFQRHTGYSPWQLGLDVELELELGIDSITLAEVLADVHKACGLSKREAASGLTTIAAIISHMRELMTETEGVAALSPVAETQVDAPVAETQAEAPAPEDPLVALVLRLVSRHTGYSSESLDRDANLEEELGIDSVTRVSLLADIAKGAKLGGEADFPDDVVTINGILRHLRSPGETQDLELQAQAQPTPPEPVAAPEAEAQDETPRPQLTKVVDLSEKTAAAENAQVPSGQDTRTMKDFVGIQDRDLFHKTREFSRFYRSKQQEGLYWYGMPLTSSCRNRAVIFDEVTGQEREFLMFASNNYLGLANHPRVIEAIADAARTYGATNTGCRLIGGSNVLHKELEQRLAALKGREACIVYPSGYSANLGCISALAGPHDLVFTDALNHMSIQDGCKLSGAGRRIYQHSLDSLERALEKSSDHEGGRLIVTDGVFSMHGDIVDLPRLMELARAYGARVLVDDAHSTGVLGRKGSGTTEHFHMKGQVDLEVGTMSKALSGLGGFVCGDADTVEYLRFYSNSYVFAATIPAPVAAGLIAALEVMESEPERLSDLWCNIHHLRASLLRVGFDLENTESAIIPVLVGDDQLTLEFGRAVRKRGMYCQTVVYPGIAVGDARLRISVTSEHTREDLDQAAGILVEAAKEVGVPFGR